jgi:uncharacterized protein
MKNKIINFVIDHPFRTMLLLLVVLLPLLPGLTKVKEDYGAKIWYSKNNPMIKQLEEFERTYGNDETIGIALHKKSGIFDKETLKLIEKITEEAWLLKDVIRVDSIASYNTSKGIGDDIVIEPLYENPESLTDAEISTIKARALRDKVLPNYLISPDGKLALISGKLRPSFTGNLDNQLIVASAEKLIKKLEPLLSVDSQLFSFGTSAVTDAYRSVSHDDVQSTMPLLMLVIVGFLFYTFRSKEGIYIPLILIFTSVILTFGFSGHMSITFNNLAATIPGILTAICIADTVHLLTTFYMNLSDGMEMKVALRRSLEKNIGPTFFTSISTGIGFVTLVSSDIIPIKDLGILSAFGTCIAWILTIFLIPAIFGIFPARLFIPKTGYKIKRTKWLTIERCERYVRWLFKYKFYIVTFFTLTSLTCVYLSFQNRVNSNPLDYFSESVKIRKDYDLIKQHMGGIGGPQIVVHSGKADGVKSSDFLNKVEQYDAWIRKNIEGVATTVSSLDIVKKMNQDFNAGDPAFYKIPDDNNKIAQFLFLYSLSLPQGMSLHDKISTDYESLRLYVIWSNHNSSAAVKNIDRINKAAKMFGLDAYVSGQMPLYQKLNSYVVDTFFTSMGLAVILVGLFMIFIFRSFKLGSLSMLPNIIPLTFGGALMTLTSREIDLGAAINYSVCLGVVVDDTIHFLFDYNRNRKSGQSIQQALTNVFFHTAPALILTTSILTVGFGIFVISNFIPNINFGLFCALIFSMALIVDLVFLPALLLLPIKKLSSQTIEEAKESAALVDS